MLYALILTWFKWDLLKHARIWCDCTLIWCRHHGEFIWQSWRLNSPVLRLLVQELFVLATVKTSQLRIAGPLRGESTGYPWIALTMASYLENISMAWCYHGTSFDIVSPELSMACMSSNPTRTRSVCTRSWPGQINRIVISVHQSDPFMLYHNQ